MIRHTVMFRLKHAKGTVEETAFLSAATVLADIPGVKRFEQLAQISPKNDFCFGFSMEFDDRAAFDAYEFSPRSRRFRPDRWVPEVEAFLEADYVLLGVPK